MASLRRRRVKQAKPDGYTLLFSPSAGMAGGKFLYANLPYDPQKDFIIAAPLLDVTFALAVGASSPAKNCRRTDRPAQEQAQGALRHQQLDRHCGDAGVQDADGL